jgi:hypothetical protein
LKTPRAWTYFARQCGKGTIAGAVGAVLAPSVGVGQLAILTLQRALTFKADGTYTYKLNSNNARAD